MRGKALTPIVPYVAKNQMHCIPVDMVVNTLLGAAYACLQYVMHCSNLHQFGYARCWPCLH